jgi:hypothetical protein
MNEEIDQGAQLVQAADQRIADNETEELTRHIVKLLNYFNQCWSGWSCPTVSIKQQTALLRSYDASHKELNRKLR